ncbi:MAG TPA: hypothetical protein VHY33_14850 [Thermoanaerobaculia bacterium]|jgi:hypothetical protein|nr:hypothetical protein [Thermoanaerobaculia bacterium]
MRIGRSVGVLGALCLFTAVGRVEFPPVPPLPAAGWPRPEIADPFARTLIARVPPAAFDDAAGANPDLVPAVFRNLASALLSRDAQLQAAVKRYATALVHEHAARIPRQFSDDDLHMLVAWQVLDPLRYGEDEEYRRVVDTILPASLDPLMPEPLRRADVNELNRVAPINFETAEALAYSAGLVRPSSSRYIVHSNAAINVAGNEAIEASIYSINSRFVKADDARRFLTAVRAAAPRRTIVVIGDKATQSALQKELAALHVDFIDNFNRPLTPWPRDPFSVSRAANGSIVFINRPNPQRNREEDAYMVRVLINGLPKTLDDRWRPRWTTGATSFHNGQILLTPKAVWISIHSVEIRALEILGLDHVPVERFGSSEGIARYTDAVRRAAGELSKLYNRPVRFVHELPTTPQQITALGGGAGFDLDSIVTLLPRADGSTIALVGDVSLGAKLAGSANEWQELEKTYSLTANARAAVRNFQSDPSSTGLQHFLDQCASDLTARGIKVRRLPLLMVPTSLLMDEDRPETPYFVITANNVVLEGNRAEGFASALPAADSAARSAFKSAGYDLMLFPPLPRSVVLNGGYRCASNEVRVAR